MTTSKVVKGLIAAAATALLVTGCATDSETGTPETSTTTTSMTTLFATPSSAPSEPTAEPVPELAPASAPEPAYTAPVAAPYFVKCYLADGTALMSDGSHVYMDSCNESAGGPYLLEDGSPAITYSPEDLADASYWGNCIEAGGTSESCSVN